MPSTTIVINEFAVASTTSAADEYIELKNISGSPVDINGWRLVYRSAAGVTDVAVINWTTSTIIPAGGYLLITNSAGYAGAKVGDFTWTTGATGTFSGASGGLALRNGALNTGTIIDSVGYGAATNAFVEGTVEPVHATNQALHRSQDTDNNSADFSSAARAPQNSGDNPAALPTLNISDVTQAEGTTPGTTDFTFSVTLTAPAGPGGVTFDIATADGTAQDDNPAAEDNDYVARALTGQSIPAGNTGPFTFTVTVNNDNIREGNETFFVNVTNIVGATPGDIQGQGTITDDDTPVLTIADVSQAEGNAGTSVFTFTVSLNQPAPFGGVTFDIATADNSATDADNDYEPRTLTTQTILEGQISYTFDVTVNGDTAFETNEFFLVNVTNVTGASVGDGQATGTITNDDAEPVGTFNIDDVTHDEGNAGTTNYLFTVSRTGGSAGAATVDYSIAAPGGGGVADSATDFAAGSVFAGTLSFADGETIKTISIDVQGDIAVEPTETFAISLSNATGGASIGDGAGAGTIVNDDALPPAGSVTIADAQIVEGNAGTSLLVLTLTRSGGTSPFAVDYATANGGNPNNASATAGSDYVAQSGTVNFGENETVKTISITINGDTTPELSEEFKVTLSNATAGATIGDALAIATITNDDVPSGVFSLLSENFDAFRAAGFAPNPTAGQFDSDVYIASGFDDPSNPSVAFGGTVTTGDLARGVTTTAQTSGGIYALDQGGGDHAFLVQPGGDDFTPGDFTIRIVNSSALAASTFAVAYDLLVRNDQARSNSFNLSYSTDGVNFIALSAFDYTSPAAADASGLVTVPRSGQFTAASPVAVGGYLYLRLTGSDVGGSGSRDEFGLDNFTVGAVGGAAAPLVAVSDVSVNEAAGTMTFTITRSNLVGGAFSVDYATADGTATAGSDYVGTSGTLAFTDNQVSATVTVTINDDGTPELDETVLLNLTNATGGAIIADAQGVGTIVNDDGTPIQVSINDVSIVEGNAGTSILTFTVTRTGGTGAFDVNFATVDGSAVAPGDYLANSGTLSFGVGVNSQTVQVTINGDVTSESNETFQIVLSGATNDAIVTDATGVGTILTDDALFIHQIQGSSYYSPILAAEGKNGFNVVSSTIVIVQAVVTAVDADGTRQGFYITEETGQWDSNSLTSEGIFVMAQYDTDDTSNPPPGTGSTLAALLTANGIDPAGFAPGDLVTVTARVMEYQAFNSLPRTVLWQVSSITQNSTGNPLPVLTLDAGRPIPNSILTGVTPDLTDSVGNTFNASLYALSYFETVEGMLVTIPDMVVADGFVTTVGGDPVFQAYSRVHADADQINSRGGYTMAGDPPLSPPDTAETDDGTIHGGRHVHDGDTNPDIIELDFSGFASPYPVGQLDKMSMGDGLGDVTGIIDFDFTDRKLFVTNIDSGSYQDTVPAQETTSLG
ncbi:MAG TPA: Calx-beta domain-containing protein, partial [Allosphingosinicella sp.]|nr:Calx-beta domain-containing protein [Allosphingosinicella sp.]